MAAKFFTGLPLDGPDPECVKGHGQDLLAQRPDPLARPAPSQDHSRDAVGRRALPVLAVTRRPDRACDEHPLIGFDPAGSGRGDS